MSGSALVGGMVSLSQAPSLNDVLYFRGVDLEARSMTWFSQVRLAVVLNPLSDCSSRAVLKRASRLQQKIAYLLFIYN